MYFFKWQEQNKFFCALLFLVKSELSLNPAQEKSIYMKSVEVLCKTNVKHNTCLTEECPQYAFHSKVLYNILAKIFLLKDLEANAWCNVLFLIQICSSTWYNMSKNPVIHYFCLGLTIVVYTIIFRWSHSHWLSLSDWNWN